MHAITLVRRHVRVVHAARKVREVKQPDERGRFLRPRVVAIQAGARNVFERILGRRMLAATDEPGPGDSAGGTPRAGSTRFERFPNPFGVGVRMRRRHIVDEKYALDTSWSMPQFCAPRAAGHWSVARVREATAQAQVNLEQR